MFVRTRRIFFYSVFVTIVLLLLFGANIARAVPSTTASFSGSVIFLLEDLNFDCRIDTVVGSLSEGRQARIDHILWAASPTSGSCTSAIPAHLKVGKTTFTYPAWLNCRIMSMICRINNDTLSDFTFFIEGQAIQGQDTVDTAKATVVFGQKGLDTLASIAVAQVDSFQTAPYVGLDLSMGVELREAAMRDLSGSESYKLNNIVLDVESAGGGAVYAPPDPGPPWEVVLYPNPSFALTNLEGRKLPEGVYTVDIVSLQGRVLRRQEVKADSGGRFHKQLQLHDIATGYYIARIYAAGRIIGNYGFVINR